MTNLYSKFFKAVFVSSLFFCSSLTMSAQSMAFNSSSDQAMAYATISREQITTHSEDSEVISKKDAVSASSVAFGEQVWMKTNLDVSTYRNGDEIPHVQDPVQWANLTTGAWCYYENKTENGIVYGKLYNWYAVRDPRGLAPEGWHIPSDEEWTTLTTFLGGESKAGLKIKDDKTTENDFAGLLAGSRNDYSGKFYGLGRCAMWWSATSVYGSYAWYRCLYQNSPDVTRNYLNKTIGFSVRCVRD